MIDEGFQTMHAFSIMLKYIVLRDITRFLIMYVFVLLGFGFAFHSLFQLSPSIAGPLGTPFNTLHRSFHFFLVPHLFHRTLRFLQHSVFITLSLYPVQHAVHRL